MQSNPSGLTPREMQVLQLIAAGMSTRQLAAALEITFKTAACHRGRLMSKLSLHKVADLVRYAARHVVALSNEVEELRSLVNDSNQQHAAAFTRYHAFLQKIKGDPGNRGDSERARHLHNAEEAAHRHYTALLRTWRDLVLQATAGKESEAMKVAGGTDNFPGTAIVHAPAESRASVGAQQVNTETEQKEGPDVMVADWLKILGIDEICQWDVLVFLHLHRTALLSAENIARFMCYGTNPVVTALDDLEFKGVIQRSRLSQGVRLYQVNPLMGPEGHAFEKLMELAKSRAGRLAVTEQLHKMRQHAAISITANAGARQVKINRQRGRNPLVGGKEGPKWPKAI